MENKRAHDINETHSPKLLQLHAKHSRAWIKPLNHTRCVAIYTLSL